MKRIIIVIFIALSVILLPNIFAKNVINTCYEQEKIVRNLILSKNEIAFAKAYFVGWEFPTIFPIGIRNNKNTTLSYNIRFTPILGPNNASFNIDNTLSFVLLNKSGNVFHLPPNGIEVMNFELAILPNASLGVYYLTFDVVDVNSNESYSKDDFFIVAENRSRPTTAHEWGVCTLSTDTLLRETKVQQSIWDRMLKWIKNLFIYI